MVIITLIPNSNTPLHMQCVLWRLCTNFMGVGVCLPIVVAYTVMDKKMKVSTGLCQHCCCLLIALSDGDPNLEVQAFAVIFYTFELTAHRISFN